MLTHIAIRNIVLIERCDIAFMRGLCVLTGETGAGKSILLDALGLALGARAETRLIRYGKEQASVNAAFDISANASVREALTELGIEPADELLIRRILTADGKTKCFVNDVPVSVNTLKSLGDKLVEVHGQHDGRGLLDPATHREMLDMYGELREIVTEVEDAYRKWNDCGEKLKEIRGKMEAAAREKEYLLHMRKELAALAPAAGEEAELAEKRSVMMQSEKLAETLNDALGELHSGKGIAGMLNSAQRILMRSPLGSNNRFAAAIQALEQASAEAQEAETAIESLLRGSHYDPATLERIEERLFAIRAAARKYDVAADQLPTLLAEVNDKLMSLSDQQGQIAGLRKAVEEAKAKYKKLADGLSARRQKTAKGLEKAVTGELESLKMAATRFHIALEILPEERWSAHGMDNVQFQAATNKGAGLTALHKIASGGELSRFMLAMKVALAKVKSTPSLIFDEIDTGTGGAVADAIGRRLAVLGATHQVLVVTHLPQVAARGSHHLRILKEEKSGATYTQVEILSEKERNEELARMLAGEEITAEARKAAEKLLQAV
jgi:DNA repair protein RecN (Recombination protein N)